MRNVPPVLSSDAEHRRQIASGVNGCIDGKGNNGGTVTLTASTTTTVVEDPRAGTDSVIWLMPTTANAAAEIGGGTMYVSSRGKKTFTLTHANSAQNDRTFDYAILATTHTEP